MWHPAHRSGRSVIVRSRALALVAALLLATLAAAAVPTPARALPLRRREVRPSGAWSWFGDPRAVYYRGAHRRTYVGWIDARGNIQVASYDHDTRVRTVATIKANFQIDDHDNPSLLVRPDGHLLVFWSAHIGGVMYYRRTAVPEDVTAWEPERSVSTNTPGSFGYTYPNPVQLSAEGNRIWLFWRGGNFNPTFSTSTDERAWTPARTLVSVPGERPYVKYASDGVGTIHFAFTQGHPRDVVANIYYARYRAGTIERASGRAIEPASALPITPGQADLVWNAAAHGGVEGWVHDVAFDRAGRPVITFAVFPSTSDHRYHYARWDGTRWLDHEFARAGGSMSGDPIEPNYSGGVTLDHEDPSTVYLARRVAGVFQVEVWRTPDGGHTWTHRAVTGGTARGSYRPVSPRGQTGPDWNVVWMHGGYPSFTSFQTGIEAEALSPDVVAPAVVADAPGRLEVVAGDGTGALQRKSYQAGWSDWSGLGRGPAGHPLGPPTVTAWGADHLDLFAADRTTGHLLQRTLQGGVWGAWADRGAGPAGHPVAAPAAVAWAPGRLDVLARDGVTSDLLHWAFDGAWHGPARVAASPGGAFTPSVAAWAPGRLDLVTVTSRGVLAHLYYSGGRWSRWESLGLGPAGVPYAAPAAVAAWGSRRLDVFAAPSGGRGLVHRWFDGVGTTGWHGPQNLGTGPDRVAIRGMAAAAWQPGRLDVFTTDAITHGLLHTWFAGRWAGPERLDFAGPQVALLADAAPRATPIEVSPLAKSLKDD